MISLAEQVKNKFPNLVTQAFVDKGDEIIYAKKEGIQDLLSHLKNHPEFDFNLLIDIFSGDYLHWEEKEIRFEVVYNLFSLAKNHRLFVKAQVPELNPEIDSVSAVWPAANWYEREIWDMMGIVFKGHPNLKRILMYESFEGHPLRKDYPYNRRQPIIGPVN